MKYNKDTSTYAQHITNTGHTYGNMQDTMEIIQVAINGRHMNNIQKYDIICIQKQKKKQMKDLNIPLFEATNNHYITK
jgi:hypothetical protein